MLSVRASSVGCAPLKSNSPRDIEKNEPLEVCSFPWNVENVGNCNWNPGVEASSVMVKFGEHMIPLLEGADVYVG